MKRVTRSDCGVSDLAALTKANHFCNELGLDTISMGSTMACAMDLVEKGFLQVAEIGRSLDWGDGMPLCLWFARPHIGKALATPWPKAV